MKPEHKKFYFDRIRKILKGKKPRGICVALQLAHKELAEEFPELLRPPYSGPRTTDQLNLINLVSFCEANISYIVNSYYEDGADKDLAYLPGIVLSYLEYTGVITAALHNFDKEILEFRLALVDWLEEISEGIDFSFPHTGLIHI